MDSDFEGSNAINRRQNWIGILNQIWIKLLRGKAYQHFGYTKTSSGFRGLLVSWISIIAIHAVNLWDYSKYLLYYTQTRTDGKYAKLSATRCSSEDTCDSNGGQPVITRTFQSVGGGFESLHRRSTSRQGSPLWAATLSLKTMHTVVSLIKKIKNQSVEEIKRQYLMKNYTKNKSNTKRKQASRTTMERWAYLRTVKTVDQQHVCDSS